MKDVIKQTQMEQDVKTRTSIFQMFNSGDDISIPLIQRKHKRLHKLLNKQSSFRIKKVVLKVTNLIKNKNYGY